MESSWFAKERLYSFMMAHRKSGKPKGRYNDYTFKGSKKGQLQAWLGLYPADASLMFFKVDGNRQDIDMHRACRATQSLMRAWSRALDNAPISVGSHSAESKAAWDEAWAKSRDYGLPICYVAFLRGNSTVFYYTPFVAPKIQWNRLRELASSEVLRHR